MKTITFKVNLETVDSLGLQPNRKSLDGNESTSEADYMKSTRTVFIPGLNLTHIEGIGPKGFLHHGDTFVVTGSQAMYLKKTYVLGQQNDILQIVSED